MDCKLKGKLIALLSKHTDLLLSPNPPSPSINKMEIVSNREYTSYFNTLPIYLSDYILVKSKSYDLIKENKESIIDEELIKFVECIDALRELSGYNYLYLVGTAIQYRLYDVARDLLDRLSKFPEDTSNKVCQKLYPFVARSKDFDFISYFVERYPKFKFYTIRLLTYLGEYQLMIDLSIKYKYRKKIYTMWLLRGVSKNNDVEYIEEIFKEEPIEYRSSRIVSRGAIQGGNLNLLKKYDINTVESSKLLLNAACSNANEERVIEIIDYIVERGQEITQRMMITFVNFSRGINRIGYLLSLREYDIEDLIMNTMLPRNMDKVIYLFTMIDDKERVKNRLRSRLMENPNTRESAEELLSRI